MENYKFIIKSSIFDRKRQLIIGENGFEFEENNLRNNLFTKFEKEDINALRFGVKWIRGFEFIVGRIYCIDIQNKNGQVVKLRLKSLYGIRKNNLYDKYSQIIDALYHHYFDELTNQFLTKFYNQIDFEVCGIIFNQKGIIFDKKSDEVMWENIGTTSYQTYYTIYPKTNPKLYKSFNYLQDWNASIIYRVSRQILKNKGYF